MAITQVYVDPAIAGNSGTGTIGDPYGDLQYALNTQARDATNGNQFNVKAGTAEVLAAALTLATYGTPTLAAPLVIRGYTSAANDGGIGEISGAATYTMWASIYAYVSMIDMKIGNSGAASVTRLGSYSWYINCEVYGSSGSGIWTGGSPTGIYRCYIHDCDYGVSAGNASTIFGNTFINGAIRNFSVAIKADSSGSQIAANILKLSGASEGIRAGYGLVWNNSIWATAGTGNAISIPTGYICPVVNNIIEGFSGVGGVGIRIDSGAAAIMGANAIYNCTTPISNAGAILAQLAADDTLAASPFTSPAGLDFSVNTDAGVKADGLPATWPALSTNSYCDKGAAQRSEPAATLVLEAGGGTYHGPDAAEVISTAVFGAASAVHGTVVVPAAGDVEAGVAVGVAPGAGTFAVPAEADVKDGMFYGNANEFEGELATGGGGVPVVGGHVVRR